MSGRWHTPLDPECPEVREYEDTLMDDPMTSAMGAPVDEIMAAFAQRHRGGCTRCQEYGVANIEVIY